MTDEAAELEKRNETTKMTLETAKFLGDGVIGGLSNIIDPVFVAQFRTNLEKPYKNDQKKASLNLFPDFNIKSPNITIHR